MFYVIYIVLLLVVHIVQWRFAHAKEVFHTQNKVHWLVSGLSLFAITSSIETGQVITGILQSNGLSGMWIIWSSALTVFIVPVVFAPLWAKLDFPTDNQFIHFRFSGKGAILLHVFRSVYVGLIVTSILVSFHIIAFSRVLQVFFSIQQSMAILISSACVLLFAVKNRLTSKMYTDVLHSIWYIIALVLITWFVFEGKLTWTQTKEAIQFNQPGELSIFPTSHDKEGWILLIAYLGIQWWSAQLFDGGGPEMKRFSAAKNTWGAIKTALLPVMLNTVFMFLFLMMGAVVLAQSHSTGEIQFLVFIFEKVTPWFHPICIVGFFALFISSSEGLLHWGGSFIVIDLLATYFNWPKKRTIKTRIAILSMLFIAILSACIAYYSASLVALVKLLLSISAGVAPVYILRWVWMRINAWSQLSAMLASGITTVIIQQFFSHLGFPRQLITITLITTLVWLVVTFVTPKDSTAVIQQFRERVPSPQTLLSLIGVALLAGLAFLSFTVLGVYLLFY